jgi:Subtilase family
LAEASDPGRKPRRALNSILASGLSEADLTKLIGKGFSLETQTRGSIAPRVVRLRIPSRLTPDQARRTVRMVDARAATDFDHFYYTDEGETSCAGDDCNPVALIGWKTAAADQCGAIPPIGLIDTGINLEHEALKGQAIEVLMGSKIQAGASLQDHGTAIAALLIGRADSKAPGLLPGAKIIAVDAFYRDSGTADRTDVTSLVSAMETLAERHVRIINLSLSGPPNEVLRTAIEAAQAKGIMIIAAAGNNGAGAEPSYPAAYPGVIAVTAVDRELNIYRRATHGPYVDIAAPGVNIQTASATGSGALKTGTSYAVPFISVAAALLRASHPELAPKDLQMRLEANTRDLGTPGRDPIFGFGLIQMSSLCSSSPISPLRKAQEPAASVSASSRSR